MASNDQRPNKRPTVRIESSAITMPNGATAEVTVTMSDLNMTVKQIAVRMGDATASITYTLSVKDSNETQFVSKSSIADNAKTLLNSAKRATPDFNEFCAVGDMTVGLTPSGDPTGSGVTGYVDFIGV